MHEFCFTYDIKIKIFIKFGCKFSRSISLRAQIPTSSKGFVSFDKTFRATSIKSLPDWLFLLQFQLILAISHKINNYLCSWSYAALLCSNNFFCKLVNQIFLKISKTSFGILFSRTVNR